MEKVRKVKVVSKPVISENSTNDKVQNENSSTGMNDYLKVDTTDKIKLVGNFISLNFTKK